MKRGKGDAKEGQEGGGRGEVRRHQGIRGGSMEKEEIDEMWTGVRQNVRRD